MSFNKSKKNSDVPVRDEQHPWQEIGGAVLLLQPSAKMAHEFNEVASFIWQQLDGRQSLEEITGKVIEEFSVEREQAQEDLFAFVEELRNKRLLA